MAKDVRHSSAAEVFGEYRDRLFKFIRSRVKLLEDAEDIVQDVFYQLSRMDALAQPVEQTAAWLYKTAKNKIIDRSRKKKETPLPAVYNEDEDDYIFDEIADVVFGEAQTPETEYLRTLFLEEIKTALEDLPPEQREAFELTEFQDFSVKEAAAAVKVPESTILSRKHHAVVKLRERLRELYGDVMGGRG